MKTELLQMLRESEDYLSGQELCTKLQVSRTAVWKAICSLREDGYEIEAAAGKGYRLTGVPDSIAAEEVSSILKTRWVGRPVCYYSEITSTNLYAKQMAEEGAKEGLLVIADSQTRGRGRLGRSWTTPPGTAIAMTLMLRPNLPPERISMVTLVMGMAVAEACRDLYGIDAGIKWPNDVVVDGRKLCGILTEMSAEISAVNYIVIGTGINANVRAFPPELENTATSLVRCLGHEVNRARLIAQVMLRFEEYYEAFLKAGGLTPLRERYQQLLVNCGRAVRVLQPDGDYTGTALGIDDSGRLLVQKEDGTVTGIYAGEVSVRGVYGYI